jgi:hypothetical protein
METTVATDIQTRQGPTRTALVVGALGPLTALAGVVWAIVQPSRIILLHPHGEGVWRLIAQAPLLVVAVGAFFHFVVAPGLLDDLAEARADER